EGCSRCSFPLVSAIREEIDLVQDRCVLTANEQHRLFVVQSPKSFRRYEGLELPPTLRGAARAGDFADEAPATNRSPPSFAADVMLSDFVGAIFRGCLVADADQELY